MRVLESMAGWLVAGVIVSALAAMHGVMGESLFKLIRANDAAKLAFAAPTFLILAALLWQRAAVLHHLNRWLGRPPAEDAVPRHGPAIWLALIIFLLLSAAQGIVAFSAAHIAADVAHHRHGWTLGIGFLVFLALSMALWMMRDRLFTVEAEVDDVVQKKWHFEAALLVLSNAFIPKERDEACFAAARERFDAKLREPNFDWESALHSLTEEQPEGSPLYRWNFQQPLRLFEHMVESPHRGGKERCFAIITTSGSDERCEAAIALLTHIAEKMPAALGPYILIEHVADKLLTPPEFPNRASTLFDNGDFKAGFEVVRSAMKALVRRGYPRKSIAIDITGGKKEHSVIAALTTIDSEIAFSYVETEGWGGDKSGDSKHSVKVRRISAKAVAVGIHD